MHLQLEGKRALVTGSTQGIGFAAATALVREGAAVVINGRTSERVEQAVARIRETFSEAKVSGVAADLATETGVFFLLEQVPELDILVNNMGIFEPKPFEEISDADWIRFFETNVLSGVRLTRHYFSQMKSRNWGRVIFISSESGINIPPEMIHYGMTKSAQLAIARGLAETTIGTGVTVNSILPGPTSSEGVSAFIEQLAQEQNVSVAKVEEDFFKTSRPSSILQRFITPDEVANLILYVCSPLSSATNGAALRVEGGVVRSMV